MLVETCVDKEISSYQEYANKECFGRVLHYLDVYCPTRVSSEVKIDADKKSLTLHGSHFAYFTTEFGFPLFTFDEKAYRQCQFNFLKDLRLPVHVFFKEDSVKQAENAVVRWLHLRVSVAQHAGEIKTLPAWKKLKEKTLSFFDHKDNYYCLPMEAQVLQTAEGRAFALDAPHHLSFMQPYCLAVQSKVWLKEAPKDFVPVVNEELKSLNQLVEEYIQELCNEQS